MAELARDDRVISNEPRIRITPRPSANAGVASSPADREIHVRPQSLTGARWHSSRGRPGTQSQTYYLRRLPGSVARTPRPTGCDSVYRRTDFERLFAAPCAAAIAPTVPPHPARPRGAHALASGERISAIEQRRHFLYVAPAIDAPRQRRDDHHGCHGPFVVGE